MNCPAGIAPGVHKHWDSAHGVQTLERYAAVMQIALGATVLVDL
jgi:hypothetical protein